MQTQTWQVLGWAGCRRGWGVLYAQLLPSLDQPASRCTGTRDPGEGPEEEVQVTTELRPPPQAQLWRLAHALAVVILTVTLTLHAA